MTRQDNSIIDRIGAASDWFARMRGPDSTRHRAAFAAWMEDVRNAKAYREVEAIWLVVGLTSPAGRAFPPGRNESLRVSRPLAIAAAVALLALAGGMLAVVNRPFGTAPVQRAYATPIGVIREIKLADGSRATLDTRSRIIFRETPHERQVVLAAGRARFAVAHDRARPFTVVAQGNAVVATGTLFDVQIVGDAVEVTLLEGGVDLQRRIKGAVPKRLAHLRPGQLAVLLRGTTTPRIVRVNSSTDSWPSGLLAAERLRLADLLVEANRYGARKIVVSEPSIGRLEVSGAFRPNQTEALAKSLAAALDLAVEHPNEGTIMLRPRGAKGRSR